MSKKIKIGDWVTSYSKGTYRVEKIYDRFYDETSAFIPEKDNIGDQQERMIVSKRFLNSKLEKSLSYESCSEAFISPLTEKERTALNTVLLEKPQLVTELDAYEIPTLTSVFNTELQIDNKNDLELLHKLIVFIKKGKSFLEINTEMKRLDILHLKPELFGNYTFRLLNFNEEYINKRKIWRDVTLSENK